MSFMMSFYDTLQNFVTKLGTPGDKALGATYVVPNVDMREVLAAYRTSWLARKIHDIPPYDMTREWRMWQAEDDQIEDLEEEEKRLCLPHSVRKGMTWGRLYGGAAIVLGVDSGNNDEELVIENVKRGQFKFLNVVTKLQLGSTELDRDPMSPYYNQPLMYQVSGQLTGNVNLHPSRVIRFNGLELPDELQTDGWGDPLWLSLREAVVPADTVIASIAALVQEAKVDVFTVPGLLEKLGDPAYEQRLLKRFSLAMMSKSINNALLVDGGRDGKSGEQWNRKEMTFTGLPDILRVFLAVASGAGDIPATRLLGKAPDGMNATGDGDLRNYYDMLKSRQNLEMWPAIQKIDHLMQMNLWGEVRDEVYFDSGSLWQMTPSEKATISKQKAETTQIYANSGLIPDTAMAEAVQNQLIEDGVYPGIEAALADAEEAGELPPIMEQGQQIDPNTGLPMDTTQGGAGQDTTSGANDNDPLLTAVNQMVGDAGWDESKHPRGKKGETTGGKFVPKEGDTGTPTEGDTGTPVEGEKKPEEHDLSMFKEGEKWDVEKDRAANKITSVLYMKAVHAKTPEEKAKYEEAYNKLEAHFNKLGQEKWQAKHVDSDGEYKKSAFPKSTIKIDKPTYDKPKSAADKPTKPSADIGKDMNEHGKKLFEMNISGGEKVHGEKYKEAQAKMHELTKQYQEAYKAENPTHAAALENAAAEGAKNYDFQVEKKREAAAQSLTPPTRDLEIHEEGALEDYTGDSYENINNMLRGKEIDPALEEYTKESIKTIDGAFDAHALAEDTTLWRGYGKRTTERIRAMDVGDEFVDEGFVSFSRDQYTAMSFSKTSPKHIFKVDAPLGTRAIDLQPHSGIPDEAEILLPRGMKFRVAKKEANVTHLEIVEQ